MEPSNIKDDISYRFVKIEKCNFCNSTNFKILGRRLDSSQGFRPNRKVGLTTLVLKCKCCGLVFSSPMPLPMNINDHYGVPPEDYWKPEYFDFHDNYLDYLVDWMNSIQQIPKGSKVLDIGAGLGHAMKAFESKGYDVYGLEPSKPFYDRAIERMGIKSEKLKLESIEEANYSENSFDVILFTAVLEHVYDPSEALKKTLKWLKPGGLLFIIIPSSNWLIGKLINLSYKIRFLDYVGNLSPMHEPYHLYEFSKKSFELHAKKFSYEIVSSRNSICQTFMPKVFDPILKWLMKKTNSGMELDIWLRKTGE